MVWFVLIMITVVSVVSFVYVGLIDHMKKKHPDYKGQDFLHWDDDRQHTEDNF